MAYSVQNKLTREILVTLTGGNTLRLPPRQARRDQVILDEERDSPHLRSCERAGYVSVKPIVQHDAPSASKSTPKSSSKKKEQPAPIPKDEEKSSTGR